MLINVYEGFFFGGDFRETSSRSISYYGLGPAKTIWRSVHNVCKNFYEGTPVNLHYPLLQHDEFFTMYKSPHKDVATRTPLADEESSPEH